MENRTCRNEPWGQRGGELGAGRGVGGNGGGCWQRGLAHSAPLLELDKHGERSEPAQLIKN